MKQHEDLTRIRVNDAIRQGVKAQEISRGLRAAREAKIAEADVNEDQSSGQSVGRTILQWVFVGLALILSIAIASGGLAAR